MFQGRLSFPTLVFLSRLCFKVDHVSRSTMYRDGTVFVPIYLDSVLSRGKKGTILG